jgi:hypothetical protein
MSFPAASTSAKQKTFHHPPSWQTEWPRGHFDKSAQNVWISLKFFWVASARNATWWPSAVDRCRRQRHRRWTSWRSSCKIRSSRDGSMVYERTMARKLSDDSVSGKEAERRATDALRRALTTSYTRQCEQVGTLGRKAKPKRAKRGRGGADLGRDLHDRSRLMHSPTS